jgi:hypothetical protein
MTQLEMYEKSFERPSDFFQHEERIQWSIDRRLGILDWDGEMTTEQRGRFNQHYNPIIPREKPIVEHSKVLWNSKLQSYGVIYDDDICSCATPRLYPLTATFDYAIKLYPEMKTEGWSFVPVTILHD